MASNLASTVDQLGNIKAQLAELQRKERELKDILIEQGPGEYDGDMFRATVSTSERGTLDMEAVRAKLSPQFITANTNVTEVTAVRVVARKTTRRVVVAK